MLGDHVAEHLQGAAVDTQPESKPENVLPLRRRRARPGYRSAMPTRRPICPSSPGRCRALFARSRRVRTSRASTPPPPSARYSGRAGISPTRRLRLDPSVPVALPATRPCPPPRPSLCRAPTWPKCICRPWSSAIDEPVLRIQCEAHHRPAAVDLTDPVEIIDAYVAVVDDVGAVAVQGPDALDLDARLNPAAPETWSGSCVYDPSGSELVSRKTYLALCAFEVNILEPLIIQLDPLAIAHRAGFAGGDVRAALGLGVAQAQPDLTGQHAGQHLAGQFRRRRIAAPSARPWRWCPSGTTACALGRSRAERSVGGPALKPPSDSSCQSPAR